MVVTMNDYYTSLVTTPNHHLQAPLFLAAVYFRQKIVEGEKHYLCHKNVIGQGWICVVLIMKNIGIENEPNIEDEVI